MSKDFKKVEENKSRTVVFEKLKDKDLLHRNKWKTSMCDVFIKTGKCKFKAYCMFAHSKEELRKPVCLFGEFCKNKNNGCDKDHNPNAVIPMIPVKPHYPITAKKPKEQKLKEREERKRLATDMKVEFSDDEEDDIIDLSEMSDGSRCSSRCSVSSDILNKPLNEIMITIRTPSSATISPFVEMETKFEHTYGGQTKFEQQIKDKIDEITSEEDEEVMNAVHNFSEMKVTSPKVSSINGVHQKIVNLSSRVTPCNKDFIRENYYEVKRIYSYMDSILKDEQIAYIELFDRSLNVDQIEFKKDFDEVSKENPLPQKRKKLMIIELDDDDDYDMMRNTILEMKNKKIKLH